ncbi:MAG: MFS transporter [Olsenella sp.]|nr:MFS transporter [Olsenella sp.]
MSNGERRGHAVRHGHYAYAIVATCMVLMAEPGAMVLNCAGIFFQPVSQYFGVPTARFSLYYSILNGVMMLTLPAAGKIVPRLDARVVYSTSVVVDGASYILMSHATALWQFYVAGIAMGIVTAPLIYLAVPTLISAWFQKRTGFFLGLCACCTGIGAMVFNQAGASFISADAEGWRQAYLVFGILMLACALPFTAFVLRTRPSDIGLLPYGADEAEDGTYEQSGSGKAQAEATSFSSKRSYILVSLFAFFVSVNMMVYQFFPSYCTALATSLPELAGMTGLIASACMAGQAIGKIILGLINDRDVRAGVLFAIGCGVAGILLMALMPQVSALLLFGSALFGVVYSCTAVQTPLLVRHAFPGGNYTQALSRVSTIGSLGGVLSTVFWSFVIDLPGGYSVMFGLSIACMLAALAASKFALRK